MLGGAFMAVYGVRRYGIAWLNASGSADTSFNADNSEDDAGVATLAVQPDGKGASGGRIGTGSGSSRSRRRVSAAQSVA